MSEEQKKPYTKRVAFGAAWGIVCGLTGVLAINFMSPMRALATFVLVAVGGVVLERSLKRRPPSSR